MPYEAEYDEMVKEKIDDKEKEDEEKEDEEGEDLE